MTVGLLPHRRAAPTTVRFGAVPGPPPRTAVLVAHRAIQPSFPRRHDGFRFQRNLKHDDGWVPKHSPRHPQPCLSPRCAPLATKGEWIKFVRNNHPGERNLVTSIRHVAPRSHLSMKEEPFDLCPDLLRGQGDLEEGWNLVTHRRSRRHHSLQRSGHAHVRSKDLATRSLRCYRCGLSGHWANACRSPLLCFFCRGTGHKRSACPKLMIPMRPPMRPIPRPRSPAHRDPSRSYKEVTVAHLISSSIGSNPYVKDPDSSPPEHPPSSSSMAQDGRPLMIEIIMPSSILFAPAARPMDDLEFACFIQVDRDISLGAMSLMLNRCFSPPAPIRVADVLFDQGVYIAFFPSRDMAMAVGEGGVHYFEGMRFHCMRWTALWGAERMAAHTKIWLEIAHLPAQYSTSACLNYIFEGIGTIEQFGEAFHRRENLEVTRVLLATADPNLVPHAFRIKHGLASHVIDIVFGGMRAFPADEYTAQISTNFCLRPQQYYLAGEMDRPWSALRNPYQEGEEEGVDGFCSHCFLNRRYCALGHRLPPLDVAADGESDDGGSPYHSPPPDGPGDMFFHVSLSNGPNNDVTAPFTPNGEVGTGSDEVHSRYSSPRNVPADEGQIEMMYGALVRSHLRGRASRSVPRSNGHVLLATGSASLSHPPGFTRTASLEHLELSDPSQVVSPRMVLPIIRTLDLDNVGGGSAGDTQMMEPDTSPVMTPDLIMPGPDTIEEQTADQEEDPDIEIQFGMNLFGGLGDDELMEMMENTGHIFPVSSSSRLLILERIRLLDGTIVVD